MNSLPTHLLNRCRQVFLRCQEFDNLRTLRALFVTPDLQPFRAGLQEADSQVALVDLNLAYLLGKHLRDGRAVLLVFLDTLQGRYDVNDQLHQTLADLRQQIAAHLNGAQGATPGSPPPSSGPQTNIAGNVHGPVLSGTFTGPVHVYPQPVASQPAAGASFTAGSQQCQDLAAHITATLNLLKEYEDERRLTSDPKTRHRAEAEIKTLQADLARYQHEQRALGCG